MAFQRRGDLLNSYGYKPDRRHALGAPVRGKKAVLLADLPSAASVEQHVVEVLDQGAAPFCVSHGVSQALRICDKRNGMASPLLASRLWIMYGAHAIEHDIDGFDGAFISDAFEFVEKMGFPPEAAWPYSDSEHGNYRVRPPEDVVRQAYDQISLDYRRILSGGDRRLQEVKSALASGCPVVFGTQVGARFASNELGPGHTATIPTDIDGGHCMCAVGYREDGWIRVVNSWSQEWGDGGFFWMDPAYMTWSETIDIWSVDFRRTAEGAR